MKTPDLGAAYIELDHITAIFGKEMQAGLAQAKQTMTMVGGSMPGGAAQMDSLAKMVDWVGQAAGEVDYVRISAVALGDGAKIDLRVAPTKASALAKTLGMLKGAGGHGLLAKMPADSPAFMSMSMSPVAMSEALGAITETFVVGPIFKGDAAKAKPYITAMGNYLKALDGQMVVAAHGQDGLDLSAAFGVTDAKAARAAQAKTLEMQKEPATIAYYKAMGLEVDYKSGVYEIEGVKVDVSTTKVASLANMPPQAAPMAAVLNDLMTQHIAIGEKLGGIGYGKAAKGQLSALLGGKSGGLGKQAGVVRAMKNAATDAFLMMYVSPIDVAKRLKLGGMNTFAAQLAGVPGGPGFAISAGRTGAEVQLVIDVPVALVKNGMAAVQKIKGGL